MNIPLAALEAIVDASRAAPAIEALLQAGVRDRQLTARTLLTGMLLVLDDRRPAFLTEVHAALIALPQPDQARLGVTVTWKTGPHQLTYRQVEHTHRLVAKALSKDSPDGAPSDDLQAVCDRLLEASIPARHKQAPRSLAADWTDVESWSRPPRHGTTECADPEAHWGHRTVNLPGPNGELFYGWYLSIAVMVRDENGPPAPELARRMTVCSCARDPARVLAAVLLRMPASTRSATSSTTPATPTATPKPGPSRSGALAPSWSRTCTRTTAAPGARTRERSSLTAASTARRPPARCSNSRPCHPPPPPGRPPSTTSKPPS